MTSIHYYENEIKSTNKILESFMSGKRYCMLAAEMMSGKTFAQIMSALKLRKEKNINKIIAISGSDDLELREQWKKDKKIILSKFVTELSKKGIIDDTMAVYHDFNENFNIYFRQDLENAISHIKNGDCIILWDESHYASGGDQSLCKFFKKCDILDAIQGNCQILIDKNIYVLSTTATRCAESSVHTDNKLSDMVVAKPGEGYRGLSYFYDNDLIKQSYPIHECNFDFIKKILLSHSHEQKYFVMRLRDDKYNSIGNLKCICEELNIRVIDVDKTSQEHEDNIKLIQTYNTNDEKFYGDPFNIEPKEFTIVVIRNMFRMGKRLCKDHICAIYESSKDPNHNSIAQSLLGRMCGYHSYDIILYVSLKYIKKGFLEYIEIVKNDFQFNMSKTSYVKSRKLEQIKELSSDTESIDSSFDEDSKKYPTIPMVINKADSLFNYKQLNSLNDKEIKYLIKDNLEDYGTSFTEEQIKDIEELLKNENIKISKRKSNAKTYHWSELNNSIINNTPFTNWDSEDIIVCHITNKIENCPSLHIGDLLVIFRIKTPTKDYSNKCMPSNKKDLWNTSDDNHDDIASNDVIVSELSDKSYHKPELFIKELKKSIKNSIKDRSRYQSYVGSNNKKIKETDAIILSYDAYSENIEEIFIRLEIKFNIKIKQVKFPGRKPKNNKDFRFKRIEWTIKN